MDPKQPGRETGFEDQPTEHEVDDRVSTEYVKDEEDKVVPTETEEKEVE